MPGSPQWLVRKGKEEDAVKSLKALRGSKYPGVDMEIMEIKNCVKEKESQEKGSVSTTLKSKQFNRPLLTFTVIFIVLGLCGNDTFLFYGPTIFNSIDIGIPAAVLSTLPWIGFCIGNTVSIPLMAKVQRRPQYMFFCSLMSAAMFTFAAALILMPGDARTVSTDSSSVSLGVMLVVSLQVATVAYGAGVGPITYTMVGEVFMPQYKTVGACVVQSVRCIIVFIFVKTIPYLLELVGIHGIFIAHGCVLVCAVVFAWFFLPETKGKTLTELCNI